jgi:uncharacterized protein RhaS with RHS repeats
VHDEDAELAWTRFRCFDADTGTWISTDPLGVAGGLNLYGFDGSPSDVVDPLGLSTSGGDCPKALPAPDKFNPWMENTPLTGDVVGPEGLVLYRAHGDTGQKGAWLTREPPPNQAYVRKELAVSPEWNDATRYSAVRLAPGTRYQEGIAAPQDFPGGDGGGPQIQVLDRKDIAQEEVLWTKPLPS